MKARLRLLAVAVLVLLPLGAQAEPRRLVLLFTGDNRGEIAPCGCKQEPQGGLARRKTAIEAERAQGLPVVLMDAGNALFSEPTRPQALRHRRAGGQPRRRLPRGGARQAAHPA